jgi:hypothetical protein
VTAYLIPKLYGPLVKVDKEIGAFHPQYQMNETESTLAVLRAFSRDDQTTWRAARPSETQQIKAQTSRRIRASPKIWPDSIREDRMLIVTFDMFDFTGVDLQLAYA